MKMKHINHLIQILFPLLLLTCSNADTKTIKEVKKIPVEVMRLSLEQRAEVLNLLGTVEAHREMNVAFKIGGKIITLNFDEGDSVKRGKLLAELDTEVLHAQREKAQENKRKARRDLERMEKLFKRKIVPLSSSQDARSLYISAGAELKMVEDRLKSSRISAPFSGRITQKLAEAGEIVGPGTPIARLTEMNPILVKAAIPDHFINRVQIGKAVQIRVDSHPQEIFKGAVHHLETSADPVSRTFRMEVRIDNAREKLRPGLIARVKLVHREKAPALYIPLDSILGFGSNAFVFVVKNQIAEKRHVIIGKIISEEVEILEGLNTGETVVVSGHAYLKHRQPVLMNGMEPAPVDHPKTSRLSRTSLSFKSAKGFPS